MSDKWYPRPILWCADADRTLAFYRDQLGFKEDWRYAEDGQLLIVQVSRSDTELIFTCQPEMKAGPGRIFISLDLDVLEAARSEFEAKSVALSEGHWGYRTMIIADPDGNELFFPYPADEPG